MLVLARQTGNSIVLGESCVVTIVKISPHQQTITVLIVRSADNASGLETRTVEIAVNQTIALGNGADLCPMTAVDNTTRIGINSPREMSVHRLELYEAIQQANRAAAQRRPPDPDEGAAGAAVPKPPSPKPPTLDVRLDEPREDVE